ncbi:hypothetical protein BS47DRAFT_1341451 [Hydnum rufescens UP504]|uniref:Rhodopsin domain-containing protein n=1 Tax=Hydnum rufescens UP504 TaxID=1448309 RepID=A0A9P6DZC6_9AGAM|nr:hypothetical protein BS47DRAFT_1341451 [Hydnum rufescens UP504]
MSLLSAYQIVSTVLPIIALLITIFRLFIRHRWNMLWWDDAVAAFTTLMIIFYIPTIWLSTNPPGYHLTRMQGVIFYYLCAYAWEISLYGARMTMLLAILRIAPTPRIRMLLKWCIVLFVIICTVLCAQFVWVCESQDHAWKDEPVPSCNLGMQIALTELVTDIVCDALLVSIPLFFLSRSSLKKSQKYRLYGIFAAGVLTTIVSIVQDVLVLRVGGWAPALAGTVMVGVSSIVSNIPVLVPVFRRLMGYESANGVSMGRTSGNTPPHSNIHQGSGGKRHNIELGDLSSNSTKSNELDSTMKTAVWTETREQDLKFTVDADIESTADSTYRHPFAQSESVVHIQPPPHNGSLANPGPRGPMPTSSPRAAAIVVHQHVLVNSDT